MIGWIGLITPLFEAHFTPAIEIGWRLASQYWNQGYGTALIQQFIAFLGQNSGIKKIITEVDPNNLRAKRCYEKVGFQTVGIIDTPDGRAIKLEWLP